MKCMQINAIQLYTRAFQYQFLERLPLLREYVKLVGMVDVEFECALYSEYGIEDNPKKQLVFKYAKKWAYPPEYFDIESIFSDIVELIK